MSISSIDIEIDREADAGYIRLLGDPVERTESVTDEVNVDLDRQGRVVGIEVLSLGAEVPFELLIQQFGVPSDVVGAWQLRY